MPKQPLTMRCTLARIWSPSPPERRFSDAEILAVLEKVGLGPMVKRVGGLDADVHSPSALSPAEQRLLVFARVLLAAPRFVFIDRMGGELNREQIDNIYRLLKETSISYLSIGDSHRLRAVPRPGARNPGRGAMADRRVQGSRRGRRRGSPAITLGSNLDFGSRECPRMSDLLHDLESCLQYRIAYGEAARLAEIARFDHANGRDAAAHVGGETEAILAEVAHRLGPAATVEVIRLAVDDAIEGRRPRW